MKSFSAAEKKIRKGLWHLQDGGVGQAWFYTRRYLAKKGVVLAQQAAGKWKPAFPTFVGNAYYEGAFKAVRVAIIADEFSLAAWQPEFELVVVSPQQWREEISAAGGVDLLFVESAWNGNNGAWQYKLAGSNAPSEELKALVEWCRQQGIPTVFWNKEDPPHFNDFLATACIFDHVFTSDLNKCEAYKAALPSGVSVGTMTFAAQPKFHSPVNMDKQAAERRDIAFAGMYFTEKYPERREQMDTLLGAAESVARVHGATFDIFSRFAGQDKRYQFPAKFQPFVRGSLPYSQMLSAYRGYNIFLNVNSVVDSPTMCARRVFEIAAAGTAVVSTPSRAITGLFDPNELPTVKSMEHAEWTLRGLLNSKQLRDRTVHRAQRKIWNEHTYTDRAVQVLTAAQIPAVAQDIRQQPVTVVCSTNRKENIDQLLRNVASQRDVDLQLNLVVHAQEVDDSSIRHRARELGVENLNILHAGKEKALGDCLNLGVSQADGKIIAKFDDDDHYGEFYLRDQLNALYFSGADLVGKRSSYAYLAALDAIVLRNAGFEHQWTSFLAGPTLTGPKETFVSTPFESRTTGEDSAFLESLMGQGAKLYSADRFNFMQRRGLQKHTWAVSDAELMANSVMESKGWNTQHVDC
ncbi:glycosyltransferase family protein [Corynebacterium aquilae]|uniref:Glycosyltransferase n=1 Tax=Corynebacterium aquilae DSM 44791 TaxID=1431546 RepID=A0A1L7CIL8_9CORY|nr:glycosyltransferase [Corynebacterium aquilae]APT85658.1 hypothetical protein CAQU_12110 [Corynebacterium aquilae DSM 44791]